MISLQLAMEITGAQLGYHGNRWAWHNPPQCSLKCRRGFVVWGVVHNSVSWGLPKHALMFLFPSFKHDLACVSRKMSVGMWLFHFGRITEHLSVPPSFTHLHSIKRAALWIRTDREILHAHALIPTVNFLFSFPPSADKNSFWSFDSCVFR